MYRRNDPRFRRTLNEISQTLETANETAQSGIYAFGQSYITPCFQSIGNCLTTVVDASCPTLNIAQRNRLRRQRGRGRSRGRAELSFDFYDDWEDLADENDGLLGWGNDEFDRLLAGSGGYGTTSQPARQRGMVYPKGRRKSAVQPHDGLADTTVVPAPTGFFGRLFGGKALRYKPSAADLQEHPGTRRLNKAVPEGEALLEDSEPSDAEGSRRRVHRRVRSDTVRSGDTTDSFSSRGDIFPSEDEDDAVPLDDEFAMVLERRTTLSGGMGPETESSSGKTGSSGAKRTKRPSTTSRKSTSRTLSSRSTRSSRKKMSSRRASSAAQTPVEAIVQEEGVPSLTELEQEERKAEQQEEAEVERKRQEAQRLADERGLIAVEDMSSKEATPGPPSPVVAAEEPSQLPTPSATDDEDDRNAAPPPLPAPLLPPESKIQSDTAAGVVDPQTSAKDTKG